MLNIYNVFISLKFCNMFVFLYMGTYEPLTMMDEYIVKLNFSGTMFIIRQSICIGMLSRNMSLNL